MISSIRQRLRKRHEKATKRRIKLKLCCYTFTIFIDTACLTWDNHNLKSILSSESDSTPKKPAAARFFSNIRQANIRQANSCQANNCQD